MKTRKESFPVSSDLPELMGSFANAESYLLHKLGSTADEVAEILAFFPKCRDCGSPDCDGECGIR